MKKMLNKIKNIIGKWGEYLQRKMIPYNPGIIERREILPDDMENLEMLQELPIWRTLEKIKENRKEHLNEMAIGYCDGRSLVLIKKMEELDDFFSIIDGLVNEYLKEKTGKDKDEAIQDFHDQQLGKTKISDYVS